MKIRVVLAALSTALSLMLSGCVMGTPAFEQASTCDRFDTAPKIACLDYVNGAVFDVRLALYANPVAGDGYDPAALVSRRYTDDAKAQLLEQTAQWPPDNDAADPTIKVNAVSVDPDGQHAAINSTETWHVTTKTGGALYQVTGLTYDILLVWASTTWMVSEISPNVNS